MNLLDRISKLEVVHKILWAVIIVGAGVFVIRIIFGLLSRVHLTFALLGGIIGMAYAGYIIYRIFLKKLR